MHLAEASWTDTDESDAELAVLPVGSIEQHGPHAPLSTDVLTAEAVAKRGVDACDEPVVVGPTIPVGVAEEHRQFTGTCWVQPDTFRAYVRETVESLASHGWDRVVLVNGHGGNVAALGETCARLSRAETAYAVTFTWFEALDPVAALAEADADGVTASEVDMGHAGALETSLLRAIRPDLVDLDRLESAATESAQRWGEWVEGVNLAHDTATFSENGVVGDPTASTAEFGDTLLERAGSALARLLETIAGRDGTPPSHK